MAKYLLSLVFIFAGFVFAQELSIEEELRLLGGDMFFIDDTKPQETVVQDDTDTDADTTAIASDETETEDEQDGNVLADDGSATVHYRGPRGPSGAGFSPSMPMGGRSASSDSDTNAIDVPRTSIFDAAVVASERSIDFARNVAEYRNPQRALLFSLLVPGLGQIYNRDYARAGVYFAAEIGFISGAVYFRRTARKMQDDAHKFARDNFDTDKIANFYTELAEFVRLQDPLVLGTPPDADTLTIGDRIFGIQSLLSSENTVPGVVQRYMGLLQEEFYGNGFGVGGNFGVQGWRDATPHGDGFYIGDNSNIFSDQGGLIIRWNGGSNFGSSALQQNFLKQLDDSRKQHNRSQVFIVGIFVNHIASATDAFISAIVHNRRLLREEAGEPPTRAQELISRMSVESDMYVDNISGDLTSRLGFVWRF